MPRNAKARMRKALRKAQERFGGEERLVAALAAFDPLLPRQLHAGEGWDLGRVFRVLGRLREGQPGLRWAVLCQEGDDWCIYVYPDLPEAAREHDPEDELLLACKLEEGRLLLSMDGKWGALDAFRPPE